MTDTSEVTRIEVIDQSGRSYTNWDASNEVELSLQDDGKTLKVFVSTRRDLIAEVDTRMKEVEEKGDYGFPDDPDAAMSDEEKADAYKLIEAYFARAKRPSLYEVMRDRLGFSIDMCDEIVDSVADWLPPEHHTNSYEWDKCLRAIRERLR